MLRLLFPRLTPAAERGSMLFTLVTAQARQRHWYVEGKVPDDLDGRFRVLATIAAIVLVRLEQAGDAANETAVALTERFVEAMEAEHRELGLGDPTLGRTVRRLVSALGRRVDLWRTAVATGKWEDGARDSLYKGEDAPVAVAHAASAVRDLWCRIDRAEVGALAEGQLQ